MNTPTKSSLSQFRHIALAVALFCSIFPLPALATTAPVNGKCALVLVTVDATANKITDCDKIDFSVYLSALLTQLIPYVLLIALVMIVFSGVQYMSSSVGGGDTKAAKQRITGILVGVVFYFLIRLILNQIAPNIGLTS